MLHTELPFIKFKKQCERHKMELLSVQELKRQGKKVFGYGASTKGNVLLQYCEINENLLPYIADVNEDKFGCYTPVQIFLL